MRPTVYLLVAAAVLALAHSAYTQNGHVPALQGQQDLSKELLEKAENGLALARFDPSAKLSLKLLFFGGRQDALRLDCCSRMEAATISRNRVVAIDLSTAPEPDIARVISDPAYLIASGRAYGGELVVMDARGRVTKRSVARLNSGTVSLSHDEENFAFVGTPLGEALPERGVYIASVQDMGILKLMSVPAAEHSVINAVTGSRLDWSPDGDRLLLSDNGSIWLIDVKAGRQPQKVLDGGSAVWSPNGDWISYVTGQLRPALFNVVTGQSRIIDPAGKTIAPLDWSPDGKYLLLLEDRGFVYRVSDGAFASLPAYSMRAGTEQWIQLK
jgi:Tol biopolymer transport system component